MSSKRIIIVTRAMTAGGAERVIAQLSNYFVSQNIICEIITMNKSEIMYDLDSKVVCSAIGRKSNNKIIDRFLRYSLLRKTIKSKSPDVVLSLPEDTGIYVILSLIGTGIPVYVSERNNPWVMPDVKLTRILRRIAYPFAKGIIFQTDMAKSFFSRNIQRKSVVLANPVDVTRIPEQFNGTREKTIVAAGRLEKQKNFPLLIETFSEFVKKHTDYKLYIYGEGRLRSDLETLVENLDLCDKVFLLGRKSNLLELMNSASVFVLSSDYEGIPNVLLEAMCMGMPVISTDCPSGGPRELIKNGQNGLLVPVNDKKKLLAAMEKCADNDNSKKYATNAYALRDTLTDNDIFQGWQDYLFK